MGLIHQYFPGNFIKFVLKIQLKYLGPAISCNCRIDENAKIDCFAQTSHYYRVQLQSLFPKRYTVHPFSKNVKLICFHRAFQLISVKSLFFLTVLHLNGFYSFFEFSLDVCIVLTIQCIPEKKTLVNTNLLENILLENKFL